MREISYGSISTEEIMKNLQPILEKRRKCNENGEIHGYKKLPYGARVKHIGPPEQIGSINGINYYTCNHCTYPFQTRWNLEDRKRYKEMMDRRFTI